MSNYIYTINGEYRRLKKKDVIEMFDTSITTSNISSDGRCGPSNGGKICPGNQCCSQFGWCGGVKGTPSTWCFNNGRGANNGIYDTRDVSTNGRCGPNNGGTICPGNQCCSEYGWCGGIRGTTSAWCSNNGRGVDGGGYDTTDAMIQEAIRKEAERKEAERKEAERKEAERKEAARIEAARIEAARIEATRIEAAHKEAERKEAERKEVERKEVERKEAERKEVERKEAERKEAERKEVERKEVERKEVERKKAERKEVERKEVERKKAARKNTKQNTDNISNNGRCGNAKGNYEGKGKNCPGNQCCSIHGWCGGIKGKKSDWCSVDLGKGSYGGAFGGKYDYND